MDRISVKCIVVMNHKKITPLKIRYEGLEGAHIVKIDKIISKDVKKLLATMNSYASIEFSFKCENIEEGIRKYSTLTCNNQSCMWHMTI